MPEAAAEYSRYAVEFSPAASDVRRQLSERLQVSLFDVIDLLAENPDAHPHRTRPIGRSGDVFLYTHPQPPLEITYELNRSDRRLLLLHFAAPVVQLRKPVFVSYSHEDILWLEKLRKFLNPLEQQGLVRIWDDQEIAPGSVWLNEIRESLESARLAVLLVTQNFLISPFIQREELVPLLRKAEQQGLAVIWVAVSACTVQDSEIARFQAANDPKRPLDTLTESQQNQVLTEIYEKVKKAAVAA